MPKLKVEVLPSVPRPVKIEDIGPKGELKSSLPRKKINGKEFVDYGVFARGGGGAVSLLQDVKTQKIVVFKESPVLPDSEDGDYKAEFKVLQQQGKAHGKFSTAPLDKETPELVKFSFMMDYEQGVNLAQFVAARADAPTPLSAVRWLDIGIQAVTEVQKFHNMGWIHRDINPNNFMYDRANNKITVIDFGLAKPLAKGAEFFSQYSVGSTAYFAPEIEEANRNEVPSEKNEVQQKSKTRAYSHASDVYALGLTLKKVYGLSDDVKAEVKSPFVNNPALKMLLDQMTNPDASKRPSLEAVEKFLQEFRAQSLLIDQECVAIVDVREFANSDAVKQQQFVSALKNFDEVVLVDNAESKYPPVKPLDLIKIKRDMEEKQIVVKPEMLKVSDSKGLADIPAHFEAKQDKVVRAFMNVSVNPPVKTSGLEKKGVAHVVVSHADSQVYKAEVKNHLESQVISVAAFNQVKSVLVSEKNRLLQKYTKTTGSEKDIAMQRVAELNKQLSLMENRKGQMTYASLFKVLEIIQVKMQPTGGLKKVFGMKSEGQKALDKLVSEVKKQVVEENKAAPPAFKR